MVYDFSSSGGSNPLDFTVFNYKLYFRVYNSSIGRSELWKYDVTNNPVKIFDISSDWSYQYSNNLIA